MAHISASATSPAAAHVLITGVTGFVGQAVLERVLATSDAHVTLLIRPQGTHTAQQRLARLLTKPVFAAWRAEVGDTDAERQIAERITVLDGDLTHVPPLPHDLTCVVHSASSVNFDDPIDQAFTVNVGGPRALYEALLATGSSPHVVHVSTSYVWTNRCAVGLERSVDHDVDWRSEYDAAIAAGAAAAADKDDLVDALRRAGRRRARDLGWTDAYTMTKALGERVAEELWAGTGHRLTIARPTIIESAQRLPYPGWIDGFKVADPLIAAYARGELIGFPGRPENIFDVIPVDHVVGAVLAAAAEPLPAGQVRYLQIGSGTTNPIRLDELRQHVQDHFTAHPWVDREGRTAYPKAWQFSEPGTLRTWLRRRRGALNVLHTLLRHAPAAMRPHRRRVERTLVLLAKMDRFIDLYEPYALSPTVYDDTQTRALLSRTSQPATFDVTGIEWERYLRDSHLPSLVELMRGHPRRRPDTATRPEAATPGEVEATTAPDLTPALQRQIDAARASVRAVERRRRGHHGTQLPTRTVEERRRRVAGEPTPRP